MAKKKERLWLKFLIAIFIDVLDFTIGRIIGFGTLFDVFQGIIALKLWGPEGVGVFWEVLDPTDQIDGFIPSMTITGIMVVILRWAS